MDGQGTFIVIEGTDGSGKSTQFKLLVERLKDEGYNVATFKFPRYDEASSYFVRTYLNGEYGAADEVGPYAGSLFYALDRYAGAPQIRAALTEGKVVLVDRYVESNMAHQGTKFTHASGRRDYFTWLDNLEFEMLKIPRPNASFVLRVPVEISQKLMADKHHDVHETDASHLHRALKVFDELSQLFPKDFVRIDCARDNQLLGIETIHEMIWQKAQPMLPAKKPKASKIATQEATSATTIIANPYVRKNKNGQTEITTEGAAFLKEAVSSAQGNVYAFTDKLSPITIAAAMARLSRRGDDMRITILDEFATQAGKDEKLLQRVITAYGDDSVQQLVGQHIVVENASNILTKKLEWGRLAAYLEQSTRYIYFDQKDAHGYYKYHTPEHLDTKTKKLYRQHMNQLFSLYSELVHKLTDYVRGNSTVPPEERDTAFNGAIRAQACDAARPVLPVATTSTVGIFASGQALENLIMHLLSDPFAEARKTGEDMLTEARKVVPTFLERADKPDRGGAMIAYRANTFNAIGKLAKQYLQGGQANDTAAIRLVDVWPRNELDLVPDMLYEHSNLSLKELQREVATWTYNQKTEVFKAYMGERLNRRHKPGRAIEKAHYSWDLVCDYGSFRDLQRHRMVDDLEWQELTPNYGYEIPQLVEDAGLSKQFKACFDISLKLHGLLQKAGYKLEAQYATLLGHKMRWKVTYNAREAFHLHELRTSPQGHPGYRKLVIDMHEKLAEVHPMLAKAMQFVNTGEDAKLSRLAAERYTQFKLQQLSAK